MIISLIAAVANNGAIGKDNALLWHLPDDMRYFKEKTMGHTVITGRKNYFSIPEKYRPLAGRTNIILTREKTFTEARCIVAHSLQEAIDYAALKKETEVFIIGGGEVYKQALEANVCNRMYITHVDARPEADTFLHLPDLQTWNLVQDVRNEKDERHAYNMRFCIYEKPR